jgi:hypothetical protein
MGSGSKTWRAAVLTAALGLAFGAGCHRKGPAERAGEKIDKAVEQTGDALEDAGDKTKDAADKAAKKAKDAVD